MNLLIDVFWDRYGATFRQCQSLVFHMRQRVKIRLLGWVWRGDVFGIDFEDGCRGGVLLLLRVVVLDRVVVEE